MRLRTISFGIIELTTLFILLIASPAFARELPLRVAVSELPPCVMSEGGDNHLTGFSVNLMEAIGREIGKPVVFQVMSFQEKMDLIRKSDSNELLVAAGCISITSGREEAMDFSLPVMNSGFQSLTLKDEGSLLPGFSESSQKFLLLLAIITFLFAHVIWWAEKGKDAINDSYFPGIFEAIYYSITTMSTVGYGDITPKKWLGRIGAVAIMITGIAFFGTVISQFTSDVMEEGKPRYSISDLSDLRGYTVVTKKGTAAAEFLVRAGIPAEELSDLKEARRRLLSEEADFLVYDLPVVKLLQKENPELILTGPLFREHYYGIAFPENSPLKEQVDRALLQLRRDGRYQAIYESWF